MQRMVEPSSVRLLVCLCSEIQIYNLLRLKIEPNPIRIELDAVDVGIMHVHSNFPHTKLFIPFASRVQMHVFRFVHKYSWLKHIYTSLDMYPICNEILIPRAALFIRVAEHQQQNLFLSIPFAWKPLWHHFFSADACLRCELSEFNFKNIFQGIRSLETICWHIYSALRTCTFCSTL